MRLTSHTWDQLKSQNAGRKEGTLGYHVSEMWGNSAIGSQTRRLMSECSTVAPIGMSSKSHPDPVRIGITWQEPALLQIGKSGLTESVVKEAKRLLNKHKYMKVRLHRRAVESENKQEIVESLCSKIGAGMAGIRGNTAVIYKMRRTAKSE